MTVSHIAFSERSTARLRGLTLILAMIAMVLAPLLLSVESARADDTIGVSGVPADDSGAADGRTRFSYTADPGQEISDFYLTRNAGTTPQTFTVLGTDAFNDDEGDYALLDTAAEPTGIGSWVKFENGASRIQFDLAPGESRLVPFTVTIPADARPGDHAGGILSSVVTPGEQVNIDRRIATRLYLRVSGELQPGLAVGALSTERLGDWWNPFAGSVRLTYTVENVGNITLSSNVQVGVNTWFGIPVGGVQGDGMPDLLPGNTRDYETEITGIGQLGYLNPWVHLTPFVNDEADKRLSVGMATRDTILIAIPWSFVILLGLIALFFVFRSWRRRADRTRAAEWIAYTEEQARIKVQNEQRSTGEAARSEPEMQGRAQ